MPKLQGKPGHYTVPGMGYVITGSGLLDAPEESVAALLELGFTLLDAVPSAPVTEEPAVIEAIESPEPKPRKPKSSIMTTGDFGPVAPTK